MEHFRLISPEHLEVGMYISSLSNGVADGMLKEKGLISRSETLEKVRNKRLVNVIIDVDKGKNSPLSRPLPSDVSQLKPNKSAEEERKNAQKVYKEAVGLVSNLLKDVKLGNPIDVTPIESLAEDINNSVLNNQNALLCLSQIREKDQYLLEHSINVGLLMGVFGRHLGYSGSELHQMVTGGLLHDIGKIRVPNQVLNKPGKLTDDEWQEMQNHVVYGVDVLKKSPGVTPIMLDICHMHHERLDGSGYPENLTTADISHYGRIAAIVDVYDAITADRCYHKGKSPGQAIKILLTLANSHLDKSLLFEFLKCMSVYPVGTAVELSNGRAGVVIETDNDNPTLPKVKTFYNMRHKNYEDPKIINLMSKTHDVRVEKILEARDLDFKIEEFI